MAPQHRTTLTIRAAALEARRPGPRPTGGTRLAALLLALLPVAGPLTAQETTGRIVVRALDPDGAALPGVTVTVASPDLIGGARTAITDPRGEAELLRLTPGLYRVSAALPGFVTHEREGVKVSLGGAAVLRVGMVPATFQGELEVRSHTPVVDPTQVAFEQVFDRHYLSRSPTASYQRLYMDTLNQAAGVRSNRMMGSTTGENAWYVDGVDTTDPSSGHWGLGMSFDAIAEMEVSTAGFEASSGRAIGGVVTVVTRSGGNQFSGTLDVRYRDERFYENGDHYDRDDQQETATLVEGTLGGPIMRDRLWFFTALRGGGDRVRPVGSPVSYRRGLESGLGKLTWKAAPSWRATGSFNQQDYTFNGLNASPFITAEAAGANEAGNRLAALELDAVLGDAVVLNLRGGHFSAWGDGGPAAGGTAAISHLNQTTGVLSGNYPVVSSQSDSRADVASRLGWFFDAAGSHEVEGGVELSHLSTDVESCLTGRTGSAGCVEGSEGLRFVDLQVGDEPEPFRMEEELAAGAVDSSGDVWSAYLQDSWRPLQAVTVKAGLRWDRATYDNDAGERVADLEMWQPRLGVAWDAGGDGRTVVRASLGRFMDPKTTALPTFVASRSSTTRRWLSCSYAASGQLPGVEPFDPETCADLAAALDIPWRTDPDGWDPHGWLLTAVESELPAISDPGLGPARADHLVLALERELLPRTSLELSWVSKRTDRLMEDTCDGALVDPRPGHACTRYVLANLPGLERRYDAAILRLESRASDRLTVLASYAWSKSRGNVETLLAGYDYDYYPWHWVNRDGYLSDHRRHTLKLNGYLLLPSDVTVSFNGAWESAFRWTPRATPADDPEMPYGEQFVEPRGSRSGDDEWWLDLGIAKGFQVGPVRLEAIVSVANLFSSEHPTAVCERLSGCGAAALGDPISWQLPRRWEVGLRVEF